MDFESWAEDNTEWLVDEEDIQVIPLHLLRVLLETHTIVPKKASVKVQEYLILGRGGRMPSAKLYEELIKVAGEGENNV